MPDFTWKDRAPTGTPGTVPAEAPAKGETGRPGESVSPGSRHASVTECGHDGWVAGCPWCKEQHAYALRAMGEEPTTVDASVCPLCERRLDNGMDWVVGLDGSAHHVACLEDAGVWNRLPREIT